MCCIFTWLYVWIWSSAILLTMLKLISSQMKCHFWQWHCQQHPQFWPIIASMNYMLLFKSNMPILFLNIYFFLRYAGELFFWKVYFGCIWFIHSLNMRLLFLCSAKLTYYHTFSLKISGLVHQRRGLWFLHCLGNLA
jgi:hypothetical protein